MCRARDKREKVELNVYGPEGAVKVFGFVAVEDLEKALGWPQKEN